MIVYRIVSDSAFVSPVDDEQKQHDSRQTPVFAQSAQYFEVTSEATMGENDEGIVHIKHTSPPLSAAASEQSLEDDD